MAAFGTCVDLDGATRTEAAKIRGVGLQIIRDWVLRFNARGPDDILMDAADQTLRPSAKSGALFRDIGQCRPCSMDQQLAQILVSSLADPHESGLAAGRRLPRNQAQPCRKIATMFESLGLADGRNQSRRNRHADTKNRYQPPSIFVLFRPAYELRS
jgi:hypothetical protein